MVILHFEGIPSRGIAFKHKTEKWVTILHLKWKTYFWGPMVISTHFSWFLTATNLHLNKQTNKKKKTNKQKNKKQKQKKKKTSLQQNISRSHSPNVENALQEKNLDFKKQYESSFSKKKRWSTFWKFQKLQNFNNSNPSIKELYSNLKVRFILAPHMILRGGSHFSTYTIFSNFCKCIAYFSTTTKNSIWKRRRKKIHQQILWVLTPTEHWW